MSNSITKNDISSTKVFNAETVSFYTVYSLCTFLFLVLKQIFKIGFGISGDISMIISFVVSNLILFFIEKKFVFNKNTRNKTVKAVLIYFVRCLINFGFFKIIEFFLATLLGLQKILPYFISFFVFIIFNYFFDKLMVFNSTTVAKNENSGNLYKLFFNNRFVILSAGLATICISFVYIATKVFPFGDYTVIRMDMFHQYGPLFAEFYDRIIEHKSFLYSWQSGGGSSFLGNYFNYLSSPFSFIIFLFDRKYITYAITILVAVKGIVSSTTFAYYLKKSLKGHNYASAAFGVFYAFCGYFLAYYWNIMWIDGMIFLPLIALGIERIINKSKPATYIVSLVLLFFSSYYMAYMICIFSILYFICYFVSNYHFYDVVEKVENNKKQSIFKKAYNNRFINRGFVFAFSSILSALLCACTLIPVYFILQSCSATSDSFPGTFESYFDIFNMLSSHLDALETTIRSSGDDVLPNISCGILSIILVPLYFMNKDIRFKEKAMHLLMLAFLIFSFDNNVMNFIWHAFHFPNDLPFRFSFIYCFIFLILAFKALQKIKSIRYEDIVIVGVILIAIILLFQKFPTNKISELSIYVSLAFVVVWTGIIMLIQKGQLSKLVIGVTIISITFCEVIISNTNSYEFTVENNDYMSNYSDYTDSINYIKDNDKGLYREELSYLDTRMDPCLYGYNGMSIFSSMAYENYSQTQYSLGMFGNRINSYTYNTQTPVYNMFYGIKYLIQTTDSVELNPNYYTKLYTSKKGNSEVYYNNYTLPLVFETSNFIKDWDATEGNPFDVQESLIDNACGVSNVFIPVEYGETSSYDVECDKVDSNGTFFYTKDSADQSYGNIDLTISPKKSGNVFVYITSPDIENVNYSWDEYEKSRFQSINEPYILDLGAFKKGEEIDISLDLNGTDNDSSYFEIYAYSINEDVLNSAYEMLNYGALDVTEFNETTISGTMKAGYDGFIYTSIPYDDGWQIYIDGQKSKTFDVNNQLATTIKQGEHQITLKYVPKGLGIGIAISCGAWLILLVWIILKKIITKKFGKNI